MIKALSRLMPFSILVALSACADLSGVGGTSQYGCKAPQGIQCASISGTYANALRNNLPGQREQPSSMIAPAVHAVPRLAIVADDSSKAADGLRFPGRTLRMWVKPWEDADRDLNDETYIYVQTESARWRVDSAEKRNREAFLRSRVTNLLAPQQAKAADSDTGGQVAQSSKPDAMPVASTATRSADQR